MNVQRIYEYALQREHEGKNFFQSNAERMSHAAAAAIFERLAAEEQKHIEFIQRAMRSLDEGSEAAVSGLDLEQTDHFGQRAES